MPLCLAPYVCRVGLGERIDAEVAHRKGRVMEEILRKVQQGGSKVQTAAPGRTASGCPFSRQLRAVAAPAPAPTQPGAEPVPDPASGFEAARRGLYSWEGVPPAFCDTVTTDLAQQAQQLGRVPHRRGVAGAAPLAFLDHAWGQVPPLAQVRGCCDAAGNLLLCLQL